MKIIQLSDYKDDIDKEYKCEGMYKYFLSYRMDDKIWSIDIWADSISDAERRVEAIRNSLQFEGQLLKEIK